MMSVNLATKSIRELQNLIENHRNAGATDKPLYIDALQEIQKRAGKGLDFEKSFLVIQRAAQEGRFLSYKELADESGARWSQVHYAMGGHLWDLVEYAHRKNWPMLSAIVVNKQNLGTGRMEPETLRGFAAAARELGYLVTDEETFLRDQQEKVFAWGRDTLGASEPNYIEQPEGSGP